MHREQHAFIPHVGGPLVRTGDGAGKFDGNSSSTQYERGEGFQEPSDGLAAWRLSLVISMGAGMYLGTMVPLLIEV